MQDYLPRYLQFSWKDYLLSFRYPCLKSKVIERHTKAIQKLCEKEGFTEALSRLSSADLWDLLKMNSGYSTDVDNLYALWTKIEPLAHLSTKQLLHLYQEEIKPLEKGYRHIIDEMKDPQKDLILLPPILKLSQTEMLHQVNENLERLSQLTEHLFAGLMFRCLIYKFIKGPRNIDDVAGAFSWKINELNLLEEPLGTHFPHLATLDDDRRTAIYDIFNSVIPEWVQKSWSHFHGLMNVEKMALDAIISPIPDRHYPELRSKIEIIKEEENCDAFCKKFKNDKHLSSIEKVLFYVKDRFNHWFMLPKRVNDFHHYLWVFGHLTWMLVFYGLYQYLLALVSPFIIVQFALNLITNLLFYTVALIPFYLFVWEGIKQFCIYWKEQQITEALILIKETQQFISHKLSKTPRDIAHFDVKERLENAEKYFEQIAEMDEQVSDMNFMENFFSGSHIKKQIAAIQERLCAQRKQISKMLSMLARHIAFRIGDEIEQYEVDITRQQLVHLLEPIQIQNLRNFVKAHSNDDSYSLHLFDMNTDVIHRWLLKSSDLYIQGNEAHQDDMNKPWGSGIPQVGVLQTWRKLLASFIIDPKKRQVAFDLNDLLIGARQMTNRELREKVAIFNEEENMAIILGKIQDYIFKTLQSRPPQFASLLSTSQKKMISEWFKVNEGAIKEANAIMSTILSSGKVNDRTVLLSDYRDEQLSQYYALLDGADYYAWTQEQLGEMVKRTNLARIFFEEYHGQTSRAYQMIRFIPPGNRQKTALFVAKKRLSWFLNHLSTIDLSAPFNKEDIVIFKNNEVRRECFRFDVEIVNSPQFQQPKSPLMIKFLQACVKQNLDFSRELLERYEQSEEMGSKRILHQHRSEKAKRPFFSCHMEPSERKQTQPTRVAIYG